MVRSSVWSDLSKAIIVKVSLRNPNLRSGLKTQKSCRRNMTSWHGASGRIKVTLMTGLTRSQYDWSQRTSISFRHSINLFLSLSIKVSFCLWAPNCFWKVHITSTLSVNEFKPLCNSVTVTFPTALCQIMIVLSTECTGQNYQNISDNWFMV